LQAQEQLVLVERCLGRSALLSVQSTVVVGGLLPAPSPAPSLAARSQDQ